jgi:molybdate-binding protein/transcriptional regulator with XRE-family HTH domain
MSAPLTRNLVKTRRQQQGWPQAELARRTGISRAAVSAIEIGRLVPSVGAALALAGAFGCTVEDLFGLAAGTPAGPEWAWPPTATPCRYWTAQVRGRTLSYPAEPTAAGVVAHDGIFTNGSFAPIGEVDPARTLVLAGCDPAAGLLAAHLMQSAGVRLLVLPRSSQDALALLGRGAIHVAGVHLAARATPDGNADAVRAKLGTGFCLLRMAHWQEGLALAPHLGIRSVRAALRANLRWVGREPGSGARLCLDELLRGHRAPKRLARNHRAVAEAIRNGWADAGVCLRLVSEEAGLRFFPVREELFDLCFPAALAHDPRIDALRRTVQSADYRRLLGDLPGYDASSTGALTSV